MKRRLTLSILIAVVLVVSTALIGCGAAATATPPAATATTAATTAAAAATAATPAKQVRLGTVLALPVPFILKFGDGAKQAGQDYGATVEVVSPPKFDEQAGVALLEGMVAKKMDGVTIDPCTGSTWTTAVNKAVDQGVMVFGQDCAVSRGMRATGSVTLDDRPDVETSSGAMLAKAISEDPAMKGKSGKMVVGYCGPGMQPQETRQATFVKYMKQYNPNLQIIGPLDTGVDQEKDYAFWETQVTSANPDLIAGVGLCSVDGANMAQVKEKTGKKFFSAGYGEESLDFEYIKKGLLDMTVGALPYVQGYLPIRIMAEHLVQGKPLVKGAIMLTAEIIAKDGIDDLIAREKSPEVGRAYWDTWMQKTFPQGLGPVATDFFYYQ
jgi:ABC-type sugar transport system substrate-binding protein